MTVDEQACLWPYPKILAHRGGGIHAPENTLAGMRCAAAFGYKGVEFDAMLAADGVAVVIHDPQLGRTVRGSGSISQFSSHDLSRMDAGSWFSPEFSSEPVPSLEQVMTLCAQLGLWMNIEIKPAPGTEQECGRTVAQTVENFCQLHPASFNAATRLPLLSSFSITALQTSQQQAPHLPRAVLLSKWQDDFAQMCHDLGAIALHCHYGELNPQRIDQIHQAGLAAFAYTINQVDLGNMLLSQGLDAFCTDQLSVFGHQAPSKPNLA